MDVWFEAHIRRVVAEHLGVSPEQLPPDVSLADQLAADSLDMLELALALEAEFGIRIPERTMSRVRTYRDLTAAVYAFMDEPAIPIPCRARVVGEPGTGVFERSGTLTPYLLQTISEDVLRAGPDAWLEVVLPAETSNARLAWVAEQLTGLKRRGTRMALRRSQRPDASGRPEPSPRVAA